MSPELNERYDDRFAKGLVPAVFQIGVGDAERTKPD